MNRKSKYAVLLALAVIFLLALTAVPTGVAYGANGAKPTMVRFTIENRSAENFSITLFSPESEAEAAYTFFVGPGDTKSFAPARSEYIFKMNSCNFTAEGFLNLTTVQTMIVPVCGGAAKSEGRDGHKIDTSDFIKPIRVTVKNRTKEFVTILMINVDTQETTYLELDFHEDLTLILNRGTYHYWYNACGLPVVGDYLARVRQPLFLECP